MKRRPIWGTAVRFVLALDFAAARPAVRIRETSVIFSSSPG